MQADSIKLVRTDSTDPDFIRLVKELDAELAIRNGTDHAFYSQYNTLDAIKHVVIAYEADAPVSCGAIKEFNTHSMEVKRMFTRPKSRGKGIALLILAELEKWAAEMGYEKCVLETGKKQPEAIRLYQKRGYQVIPNYGQYIGIENSVCFEKAINASKND